jgi:tetratricopeptide (TPR) repeat protein
MKTFWFFLTQNLVMGPALIFYLNFTDHEVRERDYFFTNSYHFLAIWMGMGAAGVLDWLARALAPARASVPAVAVYAESTAPGMPSAGVAAESRPAAALWIGAAALLGISLLPMKAGWYEHDRSRFYIAHDYAYNMLTPLEPNAMVMTNGDNDTFPLWYIQQVEGFRKDVRIVNLSLLNTDWYIRQLRDEDPKVPIQLDDKTVDMLGVGLLRDQNTGEYIYTSRFMVDHIMEQDRLPNGWKKPPYFAVTVPEHMGLDKHFSLEGLVYRVNPDTTQPKFDEAATRRNMYEVFQYRGLFTKDGNWDRSVYKDENASTLSRNYAAAHLELAYEYRRTGQLPRAIQEMERVERMFPGYVDVLLPLGSFYVEAGDTAKAIRVFTNLAKEHPQDAEVRYYYGVSLLFQHQVEQALREFEAAIRINPEFTYPYLAAYSVMWDSGQRERALQILEQWTNRHPEDPQARALLEGRRREMGMSPGRIPVPPPTMPNLP